jgi:hypothetical protein
MISSLRARFNSSFTPEKYQRFLRTMDERAGVPIKFRLSETPCFFPKSLLDEMGRDGEILIRQLVDSAAYRKLSDVSIPAEYRVPSETPHPMFIQVDFGLVRNEQGQLRPKLVELQAFPSLYAYQAAMAQTYVDVYGLNDVRYLLSGLDVDSYQRLLRRAIVGKYEPENVILMEMHPEEQKTLPDFALTEKMLGIRAVCITSLKKEANRLYYERDGKRIPVERIYNRAIVDELQRKGVKLAFDFRDDLDVEWAGHPNWYFRISKYSIPYLKHESVPKTWFLDKLDSVPDDLENYALKPLYSFAGLGVVIAPKESDIRAIPVERRHEYILQERLHFEPLIETPFGGTKAEVRMMYVWDEKLMPVLTIVRMGRGLQMGVDHNRNLEWVGASAGLY